MLTIPGNVLRKCSVKSILIRPEYIVAQGGKPPGVFAEKETDASSDEEDDDLRRTSQKNGIQPCSQILSHLLTHRPLVELRVLVRKSSLTKARIYLIPGPLVRENTVLVFRPCATGPAVSPLHLHGQAQVYLHR